MNENIELYSKLLIFYRMSQLVWRVSIRYIIELRANFSFRSSSAHSWARYSYLFFSFVKSLILELVHWWWTLHNASLLWMFKKCITYYHISYMYVRCDLRVFHVRSWSFVCCWAEIIISEQVNGCEWQTHKFNSHRYEITKD